MRVLLGVWGAGREEHFKALLGPHLKHPVVQQKGVSACHQVPVDCAFHSRVHLGIQKAETALTYRENHKLLAN